MGQIRWTRLNHDAPARPQYRAATYGIWRDCIANFQPWGKERRFVGKEATQGFHHFCWLLSVGYQHLPLNADQEDIAA